MSAPNATYHGCYLATSSLHTLHAQVKDGAKGASVTGDVTVNGVAMSKAFFLENAAYVPQEDRLWSALTGDEPPELFISLFVPCSPRLEAFPSEDSAASFAS